jgi:hypothetical protein
LKHYNRVLSEQVAELKGEIARVESGFCFEFRVGPRWGINPRKLGALLEQSARHLRARMAEVQRDMRVLTDAAATRSWLKRQAAGRVPCIPAWSYPNRQCASRDARRKEAV